MSLLDYIQRLVKEPAPDYLFEVGERSLASVQPRDPSTLRVKALKERALAVSPSQPNFLRSDLLEAALPGNENGSVQQRRSSKAALVIPDYAVRMSVLDFEELPGDAEQQLALVRFRLRKSVPFAIDEAQVSYSLQLNEPQNKKIEVLAAAIARPVLEEYEALLRNHGFQVGQVLPSSIAAAPLCAATDGVLTLFAKLSGNVLSILLLEHSHIRVIRSVDLTGEESGGEDQSALVTTLLQQTLAFAEDELGQPVQRLILCGFGSTTADLGREFEKEFGLWWAPLASRLCPASQENAGILGLMEEYLQ